MSDLDKAIKIAVEAHAGDVDKAGAPYILHPLRVMLQMQTDEERIAAVLHDVVEDSDWTFDRLREQGFPETVVAALEGLTKRDGEDYIDFVERAAGNPLAARVKLADLRDNANIDRIPNPTEKDCRRVEKYQRAMKLIEERYPEWFTDSP
jgi:(p)ppGpp synthase/HD superfamily hydrolase